jgi:hypothetical protein
MAIVLHPRGFRFALVSAAMGEVGARESGSNAGAAVERYQAAAELDPGVWPWCAAFVCWCYLMACAGNPGLLATRPKTARAYGFESWAKDHAFLTRDARRVRVGDVVIFRFSHVGICVGDYSPSFGIPTVEGNTDPSGGRDGDGVYARWRRPSDVRSVVHLYESATSQSA